MEVNWKDVNQCQLLTPTGCSLNFFSTHSRNVIEEMGDKIHCQKFIRSLLYNSWGDIEDKEGISKIPSQD